MNRVSFIKTPSTGWQRSRKSGLSLPIQFLMKFVKKLVLNQASDKPRRDVYKIKIKCLLSAKIEPIINMVKDGTTKL